MDEINELIKQLPNHGIRLEKFDWTGDPLFIGDLCYRVAGNNGSADIFVGVVVGETPKMVRFLDLGWTWRAGPTAVSNGFLIKKGTPALILESAIKTLHEYLEKINEV